MPNVVLDENFNPIEIEKKTKGLEVKTIALKNSSAVINKGTSSLSIKMIPQKAKALVKADPIYVMNFSAGENLILQAMDHDLRMAKLGDDGNIYLTPIQDLEEEDTILGFNDDDIFYNDITSINELDPSVFKEREPTNIKTDLCNYIISIDKQRNYGVIINNLIFF